MKIVDVEVIAFRTTTQSKPSRWGYGEPLPEGETRPAVTTITRVSTDQGAEGYALGGDPKGGAGDVVCGGCARGAHHLRNPLLTSECPN